MKVMDGSREENDGRISNAGGFEVSCMTRFGDGASHRV
jgi:hypothetical protein